MGFYMSGRRRLWGRAGPKQGLALRHSPREAGSFNSLPLGLVPDLSALTVRWEIDSNLDLRELDEDDNQSEELTLSLEIDYSHFQADFSLAAEVRSASVASLGGSLNLAEMVALDCQSPLGCTDIPPPAITAFHRYPAYWSLPNFVVDQRQPPFRASYPWETLVSPGAGRHYGLNRFHFQLVLNAQFVSGDNPANNDANAAVEILPDGELDFRLHPDRLFPNLFNGAHSIQSHFSNWEITSDIAELTFYAFNVGETDSVQDVGMVDVNLVVEHCLDCLTPEGHFYAANFADFTGQPSTLTAKVERVATLHHLFSGRETKWDHLQKPPYDPEATGSPIMYRSPMVIKSFDTSGMVGVYRLRAEIDPSHITPDLNLTNNKVMQPLFIVPRTDLQIDAGEARLSADGNLIHVRIRNRINEGSFAEGVTSENAHCVWEPSERLGPLRIGIFSIPDNQRNLEDQRLLPLTEGNGDLMPGTYQNVQLLQEMVIDGDGWNTEVLVAQRGLQVWNYPAYYQDFNIPLTFPPGTTIRNLAVVVDIEDRMFERKDSLFGLYAVSPWGEGTGWLGRCIDVNFYRNNGLIPQYRDLGIENFWGQPAGKKRNRGWFDPNEPQDTDHNFTLEFGQGFLLSAQIAKYGGDHNWTAVAGYRFEYREDVPGTSWQTLLPPRTLGPLGPVAAQNIAGTVSPVFLPSLHSDGPTRYLVRLVLDPIAEEVVPENNEHLIGVTIRSPVDFEALEVPAPTISETPIVGDIPVEVTVYFRLNADHNVTAVPVEFTLTQGDSTQILRRTAIIPQMEPDEETPVSFVWDYRPSEGDFTLTWTIDPENQIQESVGGVASENNNSQSLAIRIENPPRPNLNVLRVEVYKGTTLLPEVVSYDEISGFTLRIVGRSTNDGPVDAGPFTYELVMEDGETETILSNGYYSSGLAAFQDHNFTGTWIPQRSGFYNFSLRLYPSPNPREINLYDNHKTTLLAVMAGAQEVDEAIFSGMHFLYYNGTERGMNQMLIETELLPALAASAVTTEQKKKVETVYRKLLNWAETGSVSARFRDTAPVATALTSLLTMNDAETIPCPERPGKPTCLETIGHLANWIIDNKYIDPDNPAIQGWGFMRGNPPGTWETSLCTFALLRLREYLNPGGGNLNQTYQLGEVELAGSRLEAAIRAGIQYVWAAGGSSATYFWNVTPAQAPTGRQEIFWSALGTPLAAMALYRSIYGDMNATVTNPIFNRIYTSVVRSATFNASQNNIGPLGVLQILEWYYRASLPGPANFEALKSDFQTVLKIFQDREQGTSAASWWGGVYSSCVITLSSV